MFTYKNIKLFYSSAYFLIFALNDLSPKFLDFICKFRLGIHPYGFVHMLNIMLKVV